MVATTLDLSAIRTDATTYAATFRSLIGVDLLQAQIDTFAELNAIVADQTLLYSGSALGTPSSGTLTNCTFPTLNQNTTGTAAGLSATLAIGSGGTGQTTAQAAIDALTAVSGATDEWVLTKDTASGNAVFKAAAGGGTITALNNQAANRLVTIGATTTELDGEANLTFDGTTLTLLTTGGATFGITIDSSADAWIGFDRQATTHYATMVFRTNGSTTHYLGQMANKTDLWIGNKTEAAGIATSGTATEIRGQITSINAGSSPSARLEINEATATRPGLIVQTTDDSQTYPLIQGQSSAAANLFSLFGDAANTLAQRNGTNAQTLNVYNTWTDASNYERGIFDWNATANTLTIGTEAAGTGTLRRMELVAAGIDLDRTTEDAAFVNFKATADADATSAISTHTTSGAVTHHIQIEINGTTAWIPCSTTDPTA